MKILLIALQEDCFQQSLSVMTCGGKAQNSSSYHLNSQWPTQSFSKCVITEEEKEVSLCTLMDEETSPLIPVDKYSSYSLIKRITAWIIRFVSNSRTKSTRRLDPWLTTQELYEAEVYWFSYIQRQHFSTEIRAIKSGKKLRKSSPLLQV